MLIPVVYRNGNQEEVESFVLDLLIEERQITSFRRSNGWVVIGRDPIRLSWRKVYCIPERRQRELVANC